MQCHSEVVKAACKTAQKELKDFPLHHYVPVLIDGWSAHCLLLKPAERKEAGLRFVLKGNINLDSTAL